MARQRDGSKTIVLWALSNPISFNVALASDSATSYGAFDPTGNGFFFFMHSSISNNKSKARGLVPRRYLRHLSTISGRFGKSSRGDRDRIPRTRKFTASEKAEAMTGRETRFPVATGGHNRCSLATTLVSARLL